MPFNATATVRFALKNGVFVYESGKKLTENEDIRILYLDEEKIECELGCGRYEFTIK